MDDCVLPDDIKKIFKDYEKQGTIPHLILAGRPGVGKTTIARVICDVLDYQVLTVNGSIEGRNIDTVRTTIKDFASSMSLHGKRKVVLIDEADFMNADSVQPALRGFIEEFQNHCRFIFTANSKARLIEAIHSRCTVVDFIIKPDEKPKIASAFFSRIKNILESEGIVYAIPAVMELVKKYFPDFRRTINELQTYSKSGQIDEGILSKLSNESVDSLYAFCKDKDFSGMVKWVEMNSSGDPRIYTILSDTVKGKIKDETIPNAAIIIGEMQFQSSFVANPNLTLISCMTQIMMNCEFV